MIEEVSPASAIRERAREACSEERVRVSTVQPVSWTARMENEPQPNPEYIAQIRGSDRKKWEGISYSLSLLPSHFIWTTKNSTERNNAPLPISRTR